MGRRHTNLPHSPFQPAIPGHLCTDDTIIDLIRLGISETGSVQLYHYPEGAVVYLDHHALMTIAEQHRDSFTRALIDGGATLALSWVNFVQLMEVSRRTRETVCRLLDGIQPHVVFLDTNMESVAQKESEIREGKRRNPAYLHDEWVDRVFRLSRPGSLDPLNLRTFVKSWEDPDDPKFQPSIRESQETAKREFGLLFENARQRIEADPILRRNVRAAPPRWSGPTVILCFLELVKYLAKTKVKVLEGDNVNDAWHTNVPICYCNFVVLDKQWAEAARQIGIALRRRGRSLPSQVFSRVEPLINALGGLSSASGKG